MKADFEQPKFDGYCGEISRNDPNAIIDFPATPQLPLGVGYPLSVSEQLAMTELDALFKRAGHLLELIPDFGVKRREFREAIQKSERGKCRWAALVHIFRRFIGPNPFPDRIEDIARASSVATGQLIARVAAGLEPIVTSTGPVNPSEGAILLVSDPNADAFRDGNQWCDVQYAKTHGISPSHIDRARQEKVHRGLSWIC